MQSRSISQEQRAEYRAQLKSFDEQIAALRAEELNALNGNTLAPIPKAATAKKFDVNAIPGHQLAVEVQRRRVAISKARAKLAILLPHQEAERESLNKLISLKQNEIDGISQRIGALN